MKAKSRDLVLIDLGVRGFAPYRVDSVTNRGVVPEGYAAQVVPWDQVTLVAANVDLTLAEGHAIYSMIMQHLPGNFTTDQKAALESVLNKVQRIAQAAEEQS